MTSSQIARLSQRWRRAPRRWGHPMHSLCSYLAMFPPQIPNVFIQWLTKPGDIVYDPFAGRGTTPMEACRLGRVGLGSDANTLAYILTAAKVNPPEFMEASLRLNKLREECLPQDPTSSPDDIYMLFHPRVLGQLLWLREKLDQSQRVDRFIMALLLGILHANYCMGKPPRGLSISMPNTFSMSPGYVRRYIKEHGLVPPDIDVFDLLEKKLARLHLPDATATRGHAWEQDARDDVPDWLKKRPAKLVFTSPPYLNVIKYGKYNWVRLWMLKQYPKEIDKKLVATGSIRKYLAFIKEVVTRVELAVREDGYLCLMVGDVRERNNCKTINLAEHILEEVAQPNGWRCMAVITDQMPTQHKVSRIWKKNRGNATKTDRILVLSRGLRKKGSLPRLDTIRWTCAKTWA